MAKTQVSGAQIKATDITVSDIADGAVTNAKLVTVATQIIKGRSTAGTGVVEDLSVSQVQSMLGITTLNGAFQRVLTSALTLSTGQCLVIKRYLDMTSYNLVLDGDSQMEIL